MIAHAKGYEEIGLIGFDFTLHPERLTKRKRWTHDLDAEYRCIQTYNVIDYE
jgi:hypothetical protein